MKLSDISQLILSIAVGISCITLSVFFVILAIEVSHREKESLMFASCIDRYNNLDEAFKCIDKIKEGK